MTTTIIAPDWDMSVVFPSLDSSEFKAAFEGLFAHSQSLADAFDRLGVGASATPPSAGSVAEALVAWNAFEEAFQPVRAFVYAFVTTDSTNDAAQAKLSEMEPLFALSSKLWTRLNAFAGALGAAPGKALDPVLEPHRYFLERAAVLAEKQMSPAEEDLAAEMGLTGGSAWGRLHGDVTSQLKVRVGAEQVSMPVARSRAFDTDRDVRRAAYEAELATWKECETPIAAAMNAIKGEVGMLARRRGWQSSLEHATFEANIDPATLEAMMGAARDSFPVFRRYLKAKAKLVAAQGALDWFDLFAPVGKEKTVWQYDAGAAFVSEQFHAYSERMGSFADRCFRENWVDARPKDGKRDGAFCMGVRADESRILMTWKPSFGSVSTLAHELGHAYHNLCLASRTPIQSETPMTLAETASIFCETIVSNAALATATDEEKLGLIEQGLQRATQTVVDISSRFLFEREVFEKRQSRALSANELCDLMLWAQGQTYGDGLSENRHGYMWAVKPHYYSSGSSFYNFPYMFGLLFSLGLYAIYEQDPDRFRASYDELLSSTGLADAATLAKRFEIDITTSAFWEGSLSTIARDVDRFVALVG